jgi:hypothetical protein
MTIATKAHLGEPVLDPLTAEPLIDKVTGPGYI